MKRNDANESPHSKAPKAGSPVQHHSEDPLNDWKQGDPVWDILNQASSPEPSPFFARNVVRSTRQLKKESLTSRVISLFSARRLALGAVACACALVTYPMWPTATTTDLASHDTTIGEPQTVTPVETTTDLTELIIEETLIAAADDPSIYSRDEVVAMLGL